MIWFQRVTFLSALKMSSFLRPLLKVHQLLLTRTQRHFLDKMPKNIRGLPVRLLLGRVKSNRHQNCPKNMIWQKWQLLRDWICDYAWVPSGGCRTPRTLCCSRCCGSPPPSAGSRRRKDVFYHSPPRLAPLLLASAAYQILVAESWAKGDSLETMKLNKIICVACFTIKIN